MFKVSIFSLLSCLNKGETEWVELFTVYCVDALCLWMFPWSWFAGFNETSNLNVRDETFKTPWILHVIVYYIYIYASMCVCIIRKYHLSSSPKSCRMIFLRRSWYIVPGAIAFRICVQINAKLWEALGRQTGLRCCGLGVKSGSPHDEKSTTCWGIEPININYSN